jgi:DNA-binding HxlR family transcriptional regulator
MLTLQLRELEEDGIVERMVHAEVPPRVEYRLTEFGHTLAPALDSLRSWGEQYRQRIAPDGGPSEQCGMGTCQGEAAKASA